MTIYQALELIQEQVPNVSQRRALYALINAEKEFVHETDILEKVVKKELNKSRFTFSEIHPDIYRVKYIDFETDIGVRVSLTSSVTYNVENQEIIFYFNGKETVLSQVGYKYAYIAFAQTSPEYELSSITQIELSIPSEFHYNLVLRAITLLQPEMLTKDTLMLWENAKAKAKKMRNIQSGRR